MISSYRLFIRQSYHIVGPLLGYPAENLLYQRNAPLEDEIKM
jgi:hypothetical protein